MRSYVCFALHIMAWVCRIGALAFAFDAVLWLVTPGGLRGFLVAPTAVLTRLVPSMWSGTLVIPTPFLGTFRGDFAVMAVLLFVLDWTLMRVTSCLRSR